MITAEFSIAHCSNTHSFKTKGGNPFGLSKVGCRDPLAGCSHILFGYEVCLVFRISFICVRKFALDLVVLGTFYLL